MNLHRSLKHALALASALGMTAPAWAEFNANIEFDNTYLNQGRGVSQSGRVELNAVGQVGENYFVAGKAAFLAKRDGSSATDDMWVQLGSKTADIKLGRFEAADLFPIPRDALVLYANGDGQSSVYRANALRGRFGNASNGQGYFHAAGTVNFGGGFGLELGLVETKAVDTKGVRPVLTYASGPVTLKLGAEAIKWGVTSRTETGVGFSAAYQIGAMKPIVSAAAVKDANGRKQLTAGLILDSNFGLTVGYIHGVTDLAAGDYKTDTAYVAYTMPLFDLKGASVTFAGSGSKGSGTNTSRDESGVKVRINYAF
jgi:Porin-like glycoporin RafY